MGKPTAKKICCPLGLKIRLHLLRLSSRGSTEQICKHPRREIGIIASEIIYWFIMVNLMINWWWFMVIVWFVGDESFLLEIILQWAGKISRKFEGSPKMVECVWLSLSSMRFFPQSCVQINDNKLWVQNNKDEKDDLIVVNMSKCHTSTARKSEQQEKGV